MAVVPLAFGTVLWNAARKRPRTIALPAPIAALALSRDGSRLAVVTDAGQVLWRENAEFQALPSERSFSFVGSPAPALQFSPDGKALLGSGFTFPDLNRTGAYQWDLARRTIAWSAAPLPSDEWRRFSFSSDGRKLLNRSNYVTEILAATGNGKASKNPFSRNARSFPIEQRLNTKVVFSGGGETNPSELVLSSDGKTLIGSRLDGRLQFWNVASGQSKNLTPIMPWVSVDFVSEMSQLKPSPDGRFVAVCDNLSVALWDTATKRWTRGPQTTSTEHYVVWMPDSKSLWFGSNVSTGQDKNLTRQLSAPALQTMRVIPAWGPLALSGDGRTLATGTSSSTPELRPPVASRLAEFMGQ